MIPYGRQSISDDDIEAVVDVLRSDFLTQGPAVPKFERAVAEYCGASFAVAVNSATSALHIACLALGVTEGDLVWTSPITFVASANCARYCGAAVDFVDIDPKSANMCPSRLEDKLVEAAKAGRLPKVVIPVHFAGQPCAMREIHELSRQYGFKVIEDASHAIGARYRQTRTGDCTYSDITVFSFHPVKIITTAEGGMATTASAELARRMQLLRSHGITREERELARTDDGAWYYEQQMLGFNYRMTDMQAALGISQLANIERWIDRRYEIAQEYDRRLAGLELGLPCRDPADRSALHLYPIQVDNRREIFDRLRSGGIGVNVHYIPVHRQPYYQQLGFTAGQFPRSEAYYARAISLPMYAALSPEQQSRVIDQVSRLTVCG